MRWTATNKLSALVPLLLALLLSIAALPTMAVQDLRGQIQPNKELTDLVFLGNTVRVYLRHIPLPPMPDAADPSPHVEEATATDDATATNDDASPAKGTAAPAQPPRRPTSAASQAQQIADKARTYVKEGEEPVDRMTWVKGDGSFIFHSVATGSYTLEIVGRTNEFPKYRVDVPDESTRLSPRIRVITPGTSLSSLLLLPSSSLLLHPLIVRSTRRLDFFTSTPPFSISSMLGVGTPMLLLGALALALVFITPKLSAMLDPETQKEMAQNSADMQRRVEALQRGDINSLIHKKEAYESGTQQEAQRHQERAQANEGVKKRR
ncbi:hypothetical protein ACQY0O_001084 [Thecaphora frezii]